MDRARAGAAYSTQMIQRRSVAAQETDKFEVESYLDHQAFKFEGACTENCVVTQMEF